MQLPRSALFNDPTAQRLRAGSHFSDDEVRQAEEKFAESLHLAQVGMFNLLENDVSFEHWNVKKIYKKKTTIKTGARIHESKTILEDDSSQPTHMVYRQMEQYFTL